MFIKHFACMELKREEAYFYYVCEQYETKIMKKLENKAPIVFFAACGDMLNFLADFDKLMVFMRQVYHQRKKVIPKFFFYVLVPWKFVPKFLFG